MTKIYAYGEDALTLWALKEPLGQILQNLEDESDPDECIAFFRPSFGRRGGDRSAQFGEFDLILITQERVILVESKWDQSPELSNSGQIILPSEQLHRHSIMRRYIRAWTSGVFNDWDEFVDKLQPTWADETPIAPSGTRLSTNLEFLLKSIQAALGSDPDVKDAVILFQDGRSNDNRNLNPPTGFGLAIDDYSPSLSGNYLR